MRIFQNYITLLKYNFEVFAVERDVKTVCANENSRNFPSALNTLF